MPWKVDALRQPSAHFAVRTQTWGTVTKEEGRTEQTYCFSCTKGSRGGENGKNTQSHGRNLSAKRLRVSVLVILLKIGVGITH